MKTAPSASSRFSWLAWFAAAFIATWPCCAKDVVIHAGTLLDGVSDSPRHQVTITGSVQSGRYADLVATPQNPLDDPAQWGHVTFVMKGGIVYRRDGAPTAARVN